MIKEFKVDGMTCAACVKAVERVMKKTNGIEDINVNLISGIVKANIEDDVDMDKLFASIANAGYEASFKDNIKTVEIKVEGMT
jgi:Cu+-exporting ATPase